MALVLAASACGGGSDSAELEALREEVASLKATTTAAPTLVVDSSDPIKLAITRWPRQNPNAYVVGAILESTGASVKYISADPTLMYGSMCEGDIDLVPVVWAGDVRSFEEQVDKGCVIDAATHDVNTRMDWWYPSYVEDVCPGLPDWEALNACAELFATPASGGKGRFLDAPAAWDFHNKERAEALGMDFIVENTNALSTLWSALEAASANNEPIVLLGWTPNFTEAKYDGKFIEFPDFADECLTDASWGINRYATHDCGSPKDGGWCGPSYGCSVTLKSGVWSGFPEKWPTAYAAVQNMNFTNLDLSQLMMYVDNDYRLFNEDDMEPEDAAALWLADNCARWTGWSGADASACQRGSTTVADPPTTTTTDSTKSACRQAMKEVDRVLETTNNDVFDRAFRKTLQVCGDGDTWWDAASEYGGSIRGMLTAGCILNPNTAVCRNR